MKTSEIPLKQVFLAATLAALVTPGLALANDNQETNIAAQVEDAYREGQIWAIYATNPGLDSLGLKVDVQGDTATISGTVENSIQKRLAERIAERTDGITNVENRILVDPALVVTVIEPLPSFANYVADATLEAMIESKLLWNDYTDALNIDVEAAAGVVTLTGIADTPHSRTLAGRLAATTPGALVVHNNLTEDPDQHGQVATAKAPDGDNVLDDAWITAKTNSTLLWTEGVQGSSIDVETKDGVVTLEGTVEHRVERQLAIDLAQGIRGVQRVDASGLTVGATADRENQR